MPVFANNAGDDDTANNVVLLRMHYKKLTST